MKRGQDGFPSPNRAKSRKGPGSSHAYESTTSHIPPTKTAVDGLPPEGAAYLRAHHHNHNEPAQAFTQGRTVDGEALCAKRQTVKGLAPPTPPPLLTESCPSTFVSLNNGGARHGESGARHPINASTRPSIVPGHPRNLPIVARPPSQFAERCPEAFTSNSGAPYPQSLTLSVPGYWQKPPITARPPISFYILPASRDPTSPRPRRWWFLGNFEDLNGKTADMLCNVVTSRIRTAQRIDTLLFELAKPNDEEPLQYEISRGSPGIVEDMITVFASEIERAAHGCEFVVKVKPGFFRDRVSNGTGVKCPNCQKMSAGQPEFR